MKEENIKISVNQEDVQNIINCYEKDIERIKHLEEVIKEAREYVNHSKKNIDESGMYVETYTKWKLVSDVLDDLFKILSKGENDEILK